MGWVQRNGSDLYDFIVSKEDLRYIRLTDDAPDDLKRRFFQATCKHEDLAPPHHERPERVLQGHADS